MAYSVWGGALRRASLVMTATIAVTMVSACGGGGEGGGDGTAASTAPIATSPVASVAVQFPSAKPTDAEAARFLAQSTMGATPADITRLREIGYDAWFEEQVSKPGFVVLEKYRTAARQQKPSPDPHSYEIRGNYILANDMVWQSLVQNDSLLRERVAYALSQIYVVSVYDSTIYDHPIAAISFFDMLRANSFGNFRTLIEDVAKHPGMGIMLSHMYNSKGDPAKGSVPDQNFARELMQLFTIGLWELNADGTQKLDSRGDPIPAYTQNDIIGVSRVMTGWAWSEQGNDWSRGIEAYLRPSTMSAPMKAFPAYHETGEKTFLGTTIAASTTSDPEGDLDKLLDAVFQHPNTPPFISRQLIQFLVTSNPEPAYVKRVADVFRDNGRGVRGDMKAVIKAILADSAARDARMVTAETFGRVREPVLRMANLQRLLKARDTDGVGFYQALADDPLRGIAQQPMRARTVFNDYRPDYSPPNSTLRSRGLVAPASQLINETTTYGWQNNIGGFLDNGGYGDCCSDAQRRTLWLALDFSDLTPLVATPDALVDRLNLLLLSGQMSDNLRRAVLREIGKQGEQSSRTGVRLGQTQLRVSRAIWAIVSSPEYIVQK